MKQSIALLLLICSAVLLTSFYNEKETSGGENSQGHPQQHIGREQEPVAKPVLYPAAWREAHKPAKSLSQSIQSFL